MKKLSLIALALALPACFGDKEETGTDDSLPTDDSNPVYDLAIDQFTYGYTGSEWSYSVELVGWADNVTMYITQDTDSPWEEDHELVNTDYADDGSWDLWELTLPITNDWEAQEPGVNTLFGNTISCENPYCESTMAWQIKAWEGDTVADCVVLAGSAADVGIVMEEGCREI